MNIATPITAKFALNGSWATLPIHNFFDAHHNGLRYAAQLLGGPDAVRLIDQIVDALTREIIPSRQTMKLLGQLEDLLTLKHVSDLDRPESGYFAMIDPADPVVEEICRLTDDLRASLDVAKASPDSRVWCGPQPAVTDAAGWGR